MIRMGTISRTTAETDIRLKLDLDGSGKSRIETGVGFLDHMLTLFASHGRFDLGIACRGDIRVDDHHTVEDIGIALGEAFSQALSNKKGINRYGHMILPMDEALVLTAVDFSGRSCLCFDMDIPTEKVGTFDTELVEEFWQGFTRSAKCGMHFRQLAGTNSHHIIEAAFKSMARSCRMAVQIDPAFAEEIPSTKGTL